MGYLSGDLFLKVFHALLLFVNQSNSLNSYYVVKKAATFFASYHSIVITGHSIILWINNVNHHKISLYTCTMKVFYGDYSIPNVKGLNKKIGNSAMTTTQS